VTLVVYLIAAPGQTMEPSEVHVGDTVRLRKPHPCGGDTWEVTRIGTDVGLRCLTCGRTLLLRRMLFRRRLRAVLARTDTSESGVERHPGLS
jgi:hypothetical protein